jgi:P27 family predicted phage terminase small subunit
MTMKGRPPTPTPILKARSSRWAKDREKERTAAAPPGRPECPPWLPETARAEWERCAGHLERMGVLSAVDGITLAVLCEALAEFVYAVDVIENGELGSDGNRTDKGRTTIGSTGNLVTSPWVKIKNEAAARVMQVAAQFGFTPAARARLRAEGKEPAKDQGKGRFFNTVG